MRPSLYPGSQEMRTQVRQPPIACPHSPQLAPFVLQHSEPAPGSLPLGLSVLVELGNLLAAPVDDRISPSSFRKKAARQLVEYLVRKDLLSQLPSLLLVELAHRRRLSHGPRRSSGWLSWFRSRNHTTDHCLRYSAWPSHHQRRDNLALEQGTRNDPGLLAKPGGDLPAQDLRPREPATDARAGRPSIAASS